MARLRVNNAGDATGAVNPITLANASTTTVSWASAPTNVPTVAGGDIFPIVVAPGTVSEEIIYLTAFTAGQTTGTVTRGREGTTAATASAVAWVHGPTAVDFVDQFTSAPTAIYEGQQYYDTTLHRTFAWNGTAWFPVAARQRQVFTSSGSFTVPAGVTLLEVLLVGGGGSGSSGASGNTSNGGGGGGQVLPYVTLPVTSGQTLTVTIGAGGVGPTAAQTQGTVGGNSTVTGTSVSLTASGGKGGAYGGVNGDNSTAASGAGSPGGSAFSTGFSPPGPGGGGLAAQAPGILGYGGSEPFAGYGGGGGSNPISGTTTAPGGGTSGGTSGGVGVAASSAPANKGGGGGGGGAQSGFTNGGNGGSGYCEFRWVA